MTKGLPGSGKSTWAVEQLQKYPGKYKRFNKDLFRVMLDNGKNTPQNEDFINDLRNNAVEMALVRGYDVIIDDTNFNDRHWKDMCDIAQRIGDVKVWEKLFLCTLKEALQRNAARPNPIPDHAIIGMYEKHVKNAHLETREFYSPIILRDFPSSSNRELALIVDLDGTLALNQSGRGYYEMTRVDEDDLHEDIGLLVRILAEHSHTVLIVSGRDESCREKTETWLKLMEIPYEALFMRPVGDGRPDVQLKEEIYESQIKPKYDVQYVIDDRVSVCKMWRRLGLTVLQVNDRDI